MNDVKRAIVTGASGSIGFEICRGLLAAGWDVVMIGRARSERIAELHSAGARFIECDLSDAEELGRLDTKFPESFADCSVLVNCAGVLISKAPASDTSLDEFEYTMAVNARAPLILAKAVLPYMVQRKWGRIVNVGSIYSLRATENNCSYTMSKHALSGLTRTIAKEFAEHGITCNEVCPAAVESDLMRSLAMRKELEGGRSSADYLAAVAAAIPAGRMPNPEEVAAVVVALLDDKFEMVNGVSVPIDGGLIC